MAESCLAQDIPASSETLRIEGDLTMENVPRFRDAAFTTIGARPKSLLLDLSAATFVDTQGLATLVTVARVANMMQVPLSVRPAPHLRRVLHMTGLTRFLPIADSAAASDGEKKDSAGE